MPIIWDKLIPRWSGDVIEPPEAKKDVGYIAGDKPPAKWENWLRKGTYEALEETRTVVEDIDSQLAQMAKEGVYGISFNQSIANNIFAQINLDTVINSADFATIESGQIKILQSGMYHFFGEVEFAGNTNGQRVVQIRNMTNTVFRNLQSTFPPYGSSLTSGFVCGKFFCNTNDKIRFGTQQNSGASLDVVAGAIPFKTKLIVTRLGGE